MDSQPSGSDIEFGIDMEVGSITGGHNNVVDSDYVLEPKHKVFLSHSGAQKDFVEQLCMDLQRLDRYPFFDKLRSSLPIGEKFPKLIFEAIGQCQVGVLLFSEEFFMKTKWPMLELNAMVKEFEKPKSRMRIIPLFYHISLKHWKCLETRGRWISKWEEWAEKDKRIDVEEWKKALRVLESINSLEMKEGMGDVRFRKEIVEEICGMIPEETRWDDSHVQGRSRMCKVICTKMDEVSSISTPCVVGVHGVGGIGKTTICKALCNYLASKFHDHVCHVELGQGNEMKMLQKSLKRMTSMSHEILDKLEDMDKGYGYLKKRKQDVPMFLALDNVQDEPKSIQIARAYLGGGYNVGSVVLVTARTKDVLRKLNVGERQCLEMLELEEEDARCLFLRSCGLSLETLGDERMIRKCLEVCYLHKGDGARRHFHPLALKVLGQQLGSNIETWETQLRKIKRVNELQDAGTEIFSILRCSFESLSEKQKLIFMDVALLIIGGRFYEYTGFEWLCIIYEEVVPNMMEMLEVLKRRSIVENLSGDFTRLGMHDLWREFAILEWKGQNSKDPRWVYEGDEARVTKGRGQWRVSVERMVFKDEGWKGVNGLKLADFVNVEVLKLQNRISRRDCSLRLDVSGLTNLKSLEVETNGMVVKCDGVTSLSNLGCLRLITPNVLQDLGGIGRLTALQFLELRSCKGCKALDLTHLKLLRVVELWKLPHLVRVVGLSSRMVQLRALRIFWCELFRECRGLDELSGLEKLKFNGCENLKKLPWLGQLKRLRELDISGCKSIQTLKGLGDLVNLEELDVERCVRLVELPGLAKLTKLRSLDLRDCPVQDVLGLDGLSALSMLKASFDKLQGELPALSQLSSLVSISIVGWNDQIWATIQLMTMLEELCLSNCKGEDVVPDFHGLQGLKYVSFYTCNFKNLSGMSCLMALESLSIHDCEQLERLPEFERLSSLRRLSIGDSHKNLRDFPRGRSLCLIERLELTRFPMMKIVSALEMLSGLSELILWGSECESVLSMTSSLQVKSLNIGGFYTIKALDLSNFSQVEQLRISYCNDLRRVTCNIPLTALIRLVIWRCQALAELPDLSMFPHLEKLSLGICNALTRLSCRNHLTSLQEIDLSSCVDGREILPKLMWFPNLITTKVDDCRSQADNRGSSFGKSHHLWKLLFQGCYN